MTTVLYTFILTFFCILASMVVAPAFFGAPWHPLSEKNIDRIIKFADLKQDEKFFDLGSGDGRVLIAASKKNFVQGFGVEIDPIKVWLSRCFIKASNLAGKIKIYRGNIYDFDVTEADVIYLYLTHQALDRLFPKILDRVKPSVRIVSYRFCIRNMEPVKVSEDKNLFLYRVDKGKSLNTYS